MELEFTATDLTGKQITGVINDLELDYFKLRSHFNEETCIELIEQLKKLSGKKCAIIFGNCQTVRLENILCNHVQMTREYFFLTLPVVYNCHESVVDTLFSDGGQFLKQCDLFISQRISEKNRFNVLISTKNISEKLREDTKIVWIPNVYFDGYFLQAKHNEHNVDTHITPPGRFPNGDKYVDEIMEHSGMNPDVEKILDTICDENFIPADEIQTRCEKSLQELKNREFLCDIKMSDYVEYNFRIQQIFYAPNHPVTFVLFELARRILKFIGIRSEAFRDLKDMFDEENIDYSLIGQEIPIYPSVKKFFEGTEFLEKFYANSYFGDFRADFRDFTREYILRCWHEKFTR